MAPRAPSRGRSGSGCNDKPDISTLDRSVITTISRVADERPQSGEAASATLYHAAGKALR
jgi:hypothetical protein